MASHASRRSRWLHLPADTPAAGLEGAAAWLSAGRIVAYPTDTFYGLAADPRSTEAVRLLFELKGRESSAAMPLIAASTVQVEQHIGSIHGTSARLAQAFWPGPLSLVFDAPPTVVPEVHAGRGTVAVRVPAHAMARNLAEAFGWPITATSANRSGEPPAATPDAIAEWCDDPRVLVIDGGATPGGVPSTLVDARGTTPVCLRAGAIPWDRVLTSR